MKACVIDIDILVSNHLKEMVAWRIYIRNRENLVAKSFYQNVYIRGFKSCSYPSNTKTFTLNVWNLAAIPASPNVAAIYLQQNHV